MIDIGYLATHSAPFSVNSRRSRGGLHGCAALAARATQPLLRAELESAGELIVGDVGVGHADGRYELGAIRER